MRVSYEGFCADPGKVFRELCEKLGVGSRGYHGPAHFEASRHDLRGIEPEMRRAVDYFLQAQ